MASIREQILQAIDAKVKGAVVPHGATFARQRVLPITRADCPFVNLLLDDDKPQEQDTESVQRLLDFRLVLTGRNADDSGDFSALDTMLVAAHAAVMEDRTVGGLVQALNEGDTTFETDDSDAVLVRIVVTYSALYTTAWGALDAQA